jgi:hypothetical protein
MVIRRQKKLKSKFRRSKFDFFLPGNNNNIGVL